MQIIHDFKVSWSSTHIFYILYQQNGKAMHNYLKRSTTEHAGASFQLNVHRPCKFGVQTTKLWKMKPGKLSETFLSIQRTSARTFLKPSGAGGVGGCDGSVRPTKRRSKPGKKRSDDSRKDRTAWGLRPPAHPVGVSGSSCQRASQATSSRGAWGRLVGSSGCFCCFFLSKPSKVATWKIRLSAPAAKGGNAAYDDGPVRSPGSGGGGGGAAAFPSCPPSASRRGSS